MKDNKDNSGNQNFSGFVHVRGAREHNLKNVVWIFPAMRWWCLREFRDRENRRWRLVRCMPKRSAVTWNRFRPMPAGLFHQMPVPVVDELKACRPQ